MDVSRLSELRGDVHSKPDKDCLHMCIPGKLRERSQKIRQARVEERDREERQKGEGGQEKRN